MNLSIGIVGLPNVGKSTLFNALLKKQQALVANYPFATIEPNVGVVAVPDPRLTKLAEITQAEEKMTDLPPIKPAVVNFVDIAGLVKGASEGAGLGNKFLSHIREVSVIAHVVRAFEDSSIVREGSVGVREDYETVRTELALSDLSSIANIKNKIAKTHSKNEIDLLQRIEDYLNRGEKFEFSNLSKEDSEFLKGFNFISLKPEIIVLNVAEDQYTKENIIKIQEKFARLLTPERPASLASESVAGRSDGGQVVISAKIEAELASLTEEEQKEYLKDLGLTSSGLERLIQKAYTELGLISFLTAGVKEVRAWTIKKGSTTLIAAGEIHTDFMKKFIKAEVVHYQDFIEFEGWKGAREHGKEKLEGRDYIVQDGDVIEFKIGT